jgi:hypothetical protein
MNKEQHLALKAELLLIAYAGMTTPEEKADSLNEAVIPNYKKVDYADVASYLMLVGKYLDISEATTSSAKEFMLAMNTFKTFDMTNSLVETKIIASLDAMITDNHINDANKTAILNLANDPFSRAVELGTVPNVIKAYMVTNAENYNG